MNTKTIITLCAAVAALSASGEGLRCTTSPEAELKWTFKFPSERVVTITNQCDDVATGAFWLEWRVETNDISSLPVMQQFVPHSWVSCLDTTNVLYATNVLCTTNFYWWIDRLPTAEPTEGVETRYVTSNLWMFVTCRGLTNSDRLESIPIRTETRRWRLEKTKVYLP